MRNFVIRQVGGCLLPSPFASLDQFHKPFWIYLVGMESRHPCLKLNSPSSYTPNISLLSIIFLATLWVKLDRMKWIAQLLNLSFSMELRIWSLQFEQFLEAGFSPWSSLSSLSIAWQGRKWPYFFFFLANSPLIYIVSRST